MEDPKCGANECVSLVLWPNGIIVVTAVITADKLTSDIVKTIAAGNPSFVLKGRIDYQDASGAPHKSIVCASYAGALNKMIFSGRGTEAD